VYHLVRSQQHAGPGAFGPRPGAGPGQRFGGEPRAFQGPALQHSGPGAFGPRSVGEQRGFQGPALQRGPMAGGGRMPSTTGMAPRGGRGGRE
jgi:hypothetical protein